MGAAHGKQDWFNQQFGFAENDLSGFREVQKNFKLDQSKKILTHIANNRTLCGKFQTPSVKELLEENARRPASKKRRGITFENIVGDVTELHLDQYNDGAVFQVASQFNCLEMVGPDVTPEDGVTIYSEDETKGPKCATACPAPKNNLQIPSKIVERISKEEGLREQLFLNERVGIHWSRLEYA